MTRVSTLFVLAATTLLFVSGCSGTRTAPKTPMVAGNVVAVIDGAPLTLDQFETEYSRSVGTIDTAAADSMAEYQDFLERYVNYRIKVLEAKEAGLEQDSSIIAELASYRTQYAKPYLINQRILDPIIQDLYSRTQEMVEASHILLRTSGNMSPADTLAIYNRMAAIRDSALSGVDFGDLAVRNSEDPSAPNTESELGYRGYLGYFTAGSMVPQFEDWAYRTPVGQISPIFRTRYGYHILKVSDRKPTPNDISISHIMITPKGETREDTLMARAVIDSLYQKSLRGEDFAEMAAAFSDDKQSGTNGGQLGTISYGSRLLPILKKAAFDIPEKGGVSEPVLSRFGYHIIKLNDILESKTLDDSYEELKTKASQSPRATSGEQAFADSVLVATGASIDSVQIYSILSGLMPDSIQALDASNQVPNAGTPAATIGDSTYTVGSIVKSIPWNRYRSIRGKTPKEILRVALVAFMRAEAVNHEVSVLESSDPSFSRTMNEFRNGILLFRLMEDSVWTAAAEDTVALQREYDSDPTRFTYPDRTRLITFFSSNKPMLEQVKTGLSSGSVANLPDSLLSAVRVDTTYLAGRSNSIYDRGLDLPKGGTTDVLAYNSGAIVLYNDGIEPSRGKTFDESRAELINIVQTQREDRLIERLRSKYHVTTYPSHLEGAFGQSTLE